MKLSESLQCLGWLLIPVILLQNLTTFRVQGVVSYAVYFPL